MLIASTDIVTVANGVKAPYNINTMTSEVALHAIKRYDTVAEGVKQVVNERVRVAQELHSCSGVEKVYPSQTNFLLFKISHKSLAKRVYTRMASLGVLIRNRSTELHCKGCLRVTIGTQEMNDAFLTAFRTAMGELSDVSFEKSALG